MADKQPLHVPSGEFWPLKAQVEGVKYRIVNHDTEQCLITNAKGDVNVSRCDDKASTWVIDPTNDGLYRFANVAEGTFLTQENCQDSEALGVNMAGSVLPMSVLFKICRPPIAVPKRAQLWLPVKTA